MCITLLDIERGQNFGWITFLQFDFGYDKCWTILDIQLQYKKLKRFELFGVKLI
jgi:hypothetical protein